MAIPNSAPRLLISSADGDNTPAPKAARGWVDLLQEWLQIRLAPLLGGVSPLIVRDAAPVSDEPGREGVPEPPPEAELVICVVSPRYLESKARLERIESFSAAGRRLFRVVKYPVPHETLPAALSGTPEFEFYELDVASGRVGEFDPLIRAGGENDKRYWQKLNDLAIAVRDFFEELRRPEADTEAEVSIHPVRAIYLAESTSDMKSDRDDVRRELEQMGYAVLPDVGLPRTTGPEVEEAVREYVRRSVMSVHMVGAVEGFIPESANGRSVVQIQLKVALEDHPDAQFKRVVWMPEGLEVIEERQQEFVKRFQNDQDVLRRIELVQGKVVQSLKETITDLLEPKAARVKAAGGNGSKGENPPRVYLVYDEPDYTETKPISQYLWDQELEVLLPANKAKPPDPEEHKELLVLADAVMIYYGQAEDAWTRQKLRDLRKLKGYEREKPLLAKAFYLSKPPTEDKDEFFTYEADIIRGYNGFEPDQLDSFVSAIKTHDAPDAAAAAKRGPAADAGKRMARLFCSYSHKDEELRAELEIHLKALQRRKYIEVWHDRKISGGTEWEAEIDKNLEQADIILLLVSPDFMASDYCFDVEMKRALERHEAGEARVIPVIVRAVDWGWAPFSKLNALPKDGRATKLWPDRDEAWVNVSAGIAKVVEELRGGSGG